MADQKDINNQKKFNEELKNTSEEAGFTKEALLSIGEAIKSSLYEAIDSLEGLDNATKKVGKSLTREVTNSIKNLGPSLEKSISLQLKLNEGQDISKDIAKEKNKLIIKQQAIQEKINLLKKNGIETEDLEESLINTKRIAQEDIMGLLKGQNSQAESNIRAAKRKNELLGISGGLLKGINGIAKEFGAAFGLDEVQKKMEEVADEATHINKEGEVTVDRFARLKVLAAGIKETLNQSVNAIASIEVIGASLTKGFLEIQKVQTEFRSLTGQSANNFEDLNSDLITTTEQIQTLTQLTEKFSINANAAFSSKTIAETTVLTQNMKVSAEAAGNLAVFSEAYGNNMKNVTNQLTKGTSEYNLTNKAAVVNRQVIEDVGNASGNLAANFAKNPEALAEASRAARDLGLSLQEVESIADSLLNFESSISAELEAELISGRQINLERARSAALANDMETLSNEIANNQAILNAFSTGNRIEQNKIAQALGLNADQMAKIIFRQKLSEDLTVEQARQAANISDEEATRLHTQMQIQKAVQKISQAFADILEFFSPILSNSFVLKAVIAAIGTSIIAKWLGPTAKFISQLSKITGLTAKLKATKLGGFFSNIFKKGSDEAQKTIDKTQEAAKKSKNTPKGKNLKTFLRNLSSGLRTMAGKKVFQGAINLIPASVGLTTMIPGVGGAKLMEKINGEKLQESMYGLAFGLEAMSKGKVFLGSLGLTAAATAFALMIPGSLGMFLLGPAAEVAAAGISILIPALTALGTAMGTGAGVGLAALIGMAVGLGGALALAAPAIEAFSSIIGELGKIIIGVFETIPDIITAVADGFTKFLGVITLEKAGALLAMGPALSSLAIGMGALGLSFLTFGLGAFGSLSILNQIAETAPKLKIAASSLKTVATSLEKVAEALNKIDSSKLGELEDTMESFTPSIGQTITSTLAAPLGALTGGDDNNTQNSDTQQLQLINEKLTQLINVVEKGGDINMDGAKVGKSTVLASSNLG